ncbi:MAG TPA: SUMF1/EgtB/PvdO family nonheme iron enzyme [Dokdonella sp.]|jgi:formylglycine-generating enzyme required for sulfatase activity|nr:SUMF1/EgtB/PvdO family nonheme iron enzyme [Dokdonella sp.]
MPGTENVNKQRNLGGALGIVVLLFALAYRFFPGILHFEPQEQVQTTTTAPLAGKPWVVEHATPLVARNPAGQPIVGTTLAEAIAMGPPAPVTKEVAGLLAAARKQEEEGKVFEPPGNNAVGLYRQVLEKDPNNPAALDALTRIGGAVRDWSLAALERGDEAEAQRYAAQFAELPHSDNELKILRARLKTLREVMPMLSAAAELLKQGRLIGEGENNALAVYRKVLAIDPDNRIADEGLGRIERGYLDRALGAAAQDDFSNADSILAEASAIRPGSQALLDTRSQIEGLRRQRGETVLAQARSALDAGNADLADKLARTAQTISADLAGLDEFAERLRNVRLYASFKPGQVFSDRFLDTTGMAPAVVVIPAGQFVMGSPADEEGHRDDEEPQRQVRITTGFAMGQTEVTVGQFREFVKAIGYRTEGQREGTGSVYDENTGRMNDRRGIDWQRDYKGDRASDKLPVLNVSWNDANEYVAWLSQRTGKRYRLPSEAEFEYALRAGSQSRYWWGDGDPPKVLANVTGAGDRSPSKRSWGRAFDNYSDGFWGPAPVKSYPPNPFGLYDMDGNLSEWVDDCWHDNYTRAPRDSTAWINPGCVRRVIRGGSWGSSPEQVRSAYRLSVSADTRSARVGFRVVREL